MAGVSRETLKWLQSLDLTWPLKNPKWELANGYLVAEIFSWYFPHLVEMHSFNNGKSLKSKNLNWDLLKMFIKKQNLEIPKELVDGTIHHKPGAAQLLLERIYQILTNRPIKRIAVDRLDFSDAPYQDQLAFHAKSTAIVSLRNNLTHSELSDRPDILEQNLKTDILLKRHMEKRHLHRALYPARFDKAPNMGQLCPRIEPPSVKQEDSMMNLADQKANSGKKKQGDEEEAAEKEDSIPDPYNEVQVRQFGKSGTPVSRGGGGR